MKSSSSFALLLILAHFAPIGHAATDPLAPLDPTNSAPTGGSGSGGGTSASPTGSGGGGTSGSHTGSGGGGTGGSDTGSGDGGTGGSNTGSGSGGSGGSHTGSGGGSSASGITVGQVTLLLPTMLSVLYAYFR